MNVDQSTISRDITALKEMSQQFIYDLAKSDLAHCYEQCIDGIEEAQRQVWEIFRNERRLSSKDKLSALKLIKECNESKFALFRDGPSILNIQVIEVRVIELKPVKSLKDLIKKLNKIEEEKQVNDNEEEQD